MQVNGGDKAAPAKKVWRAGKRDHEATRGAGKIVHTHGAGKVARREHERLRKEEPEHNVLRLKAHGQKREHAAPNACGVDG